MNTVSQAYDRTVSARAARRVAWQAAGVVGFALLTAMGAQIAIPVPGSPVPITMQTFFVLMAGMTLGPRLGVASMAFYLLLGMTGYHVFAAAWWSPGNFLGPTGGYLIGFVLAQPIVGALARRGRGGWVRWRDLAFAAVAGNA
ncbi:MAG: biotin transporter BioY, partial [bacterium]|nr:biotin transporter BioY [bacterium]